MAMIERVEIDVLSFPLDPPFRASIRLIPTVDCVLCRMTTRDGATGVGYTFAFGVKEAFALAGAARLLGERAIGMDPMAVEATWTALWRSLALLGQPGVGVSALAALDIALWDIRGKRLGQPLYRLLGAAREAIPSYGSGGSLDNDTGALVREMESYVLAGHRAVKMKLGHGLVEDARRVAAVREAIGPEVRLIVDATQQFRPKEALASARSLERHGLWWFEEPVPAERIDWCAEVRAASPVTIATGETNFGMNDAHNLIRQGAADILMPNLQRVGGITPWLKVAAAANLAGLPIASHVSAEIFVHLMCAVPNGLCLEVVPWWPRLFIGALPIKDGVVRPPSGAGLGFELDSDVLKSRRVA